MTTSGFNARKTFAQKAPIYMKKLIADFSLSELDAAAIMGNAGHESGGLTILQEVHPVAGRGGFGWFQWTGARRKAFEVYCKKHNLDPKSDEANYANLFLELNGPEAKALPATRQARTLLAKVMAFEERYERAGVKAYPSRLRWAQMALDAFNKAQVPPHTGNA